MPIINIMCSICTEVFKNSDDVHSTGCGHLFHFSCLNNWQTRQRCCPQCRFENPTTHKIHLSFEESEQSSEKDDDIELKLKSSNEKVTELKEQVKEVETNFSKLIEQFTLAEKSEKELKENLSEMNDIENDFLRLQAKYTDSSELIKELEDCLNQLFIQNECKSEELKLKMLENESLKTSLTSRQSSLPDGILNEKLKILEQRLKHISEEFEKEISMSTQLSIDKMKLQSLVNQLQNLEEKPKNEGPPRFYKRNNLYPDTAEHKEENVTKPPLKVNATQNDVPHNTVLIKQFPLDQLTNPFDTVIINLASKMNLSISSNDMVEVNIVNSNNKMSTKVQINAQFKSSNIKDKFLSKKNILKKDPTLKNIYIEDLHELYMYATNKLQNNGFNIFCKNSKIFAKQIKGRNSELIHIQCKNQVDNLQKKFVL